MQFCCSTTQVYSGVADSAWDSFLVHSLPTIRWKRRSAQTNWEDCEGGGKGTGDILSSQGIQSYKQPPASSPLASCVFASGDQNREDSTKHKRAHFCAVNPEAGSQDFFGVSQFGVTIYKAGIIRQTSCALKAYLCTDQSGLGKGRRRVTLKAALDR